MRGKVAIRHGGYVLAVAALAAAAAAVAVAFRPDFGASAPAKTAAGSMAGMQMANATCDDDYWNSVAGAPFQGDGTTRTYYIGADQVVWNYAPAGKNMITGKPFDQVADTYVERGPGRIGSRYVKCL